MHSIASRLTELEVKAVAATSRPSTKPERRPAIPAAAPERRSALAARSGADKLARYIKTQQNSQILRGWPKTQVIAGFQRSRAHLPQPM